MKTSCYGEVNSLLDKSSIINLLIVNYEHRIGI
jgi:hypothetical protein